MLTNAGDIAVTETELRATFTSQLAAPDCRARRAMRRARRARAAFPGTRLRVRYAVAAPKLDTFPAG